MNFSIFITLPEEKIRRRYAQIAAAAQLKLTRTRIGHPRAVLYGDMKKLKTGASRNSSSDVRRSLLSLLRPTNTNPAFKPRASQQNFAVAISAETDHFDAAMIPEHKGYSIGVCNSDDDLERG